MACFESVYFYIIRYAQYIIFHKFIYVYKMHAKSVLV